MVGSYSLSDTLLNDFGDVSVSLIGEDSSISFFDFLDDFFSLDLSNFWGDWFSRVSSNFSEDSFLIGSSNFLRDFLLIGSTNFSGDCFPFVFLGECFLVSMSAFDLLFFLESDWWVSVDLTLMLDAEFSSQIFLLN